MNCSRFQADCEITIEVVATGEGVEIVEGIVVVGVEEVLKVVVKVVVEVVVVIEVIVLMIVVVKIVK